MKEKATESGEARRAGLVDVDWYLQQYPEVAFLGMDPVELYLLLGAKMGRRPSPYTRRVAVFAAFDPDDRIPDHTVFYVAELAKHVDAIVFVADNPLDETQRAKVSSYVTAFIHGRHGEYDFGSYKRGFVLARDRGLLDGADELLFCNDSCYGPIHGFAPMFAEMANSNADFWGITDSDQFNHHVQSYFICLKRPVFQHEAFIKFLLAVKPEKSVRDVILNYELKLTPTLVDAGFRPSALIRERLPQDHGGRYPNVEHYPGHLMDRNSPLIKVKSLKKAGCNLESIPATLAKLRQENPELLEVVLGDSEVAKFQQAEKLKFSFIMPTYNRGYCIEKAIDSLLAQHHQNFELIIVDDGSDDGTDVLIRERYEAMIATGKLIYMKMPKRIGVSAARNIGILAASGPWIAYIDSDNTIRPYFLSLFAEHIIANPNAYTFYAQLCRIDDGHVTGKAFDFEALKRGNYIDLGVFVHHRRCFEEMGGFDVKLRRLVDWDLILSYTERYPPVFIPHIVMDYSNSGNVTRISTTESLVAAKLAVMRKHSDLPTVTTAVMTYNQEKYLAQAIDSAVMQRGDFLHEILISDDGSSDGTGRIAMDYANRNPELIRNVSGGPNLGISGNFRKCIEAASGKYLAILEGDDFWTDDHKLDKQVRFLEQNDDCIMVFSKLDVLNEAKGTKSTLKRQDVLTKSKLDGSDFLADPSMNLIGNFSCCLFRTDSLRYAPPLLFEKRISEIAVAFYLENFGKIGFIDEVLSVYRQHPQGVWTGSGRSEQLKSGLVTRETVLRVAHPRYAKQIRDIIEHQYRRPLSELKSTAAA